MSTESKDGGPAFPFAATDHSNREMQTPGMTMRDWFAGQVVTAYMGWSLNRPPVDDSDNRERAAKRYAEVAYEIADAMLAARAKAAP